MRKEKKRKREEKKGKKQKGKDKENWWMHDHPGDYFSESITSSYSQSIL